MSYIKQSAGAASVEVFTDSANLRLDPRVKFRPYGYAETIEFYGVGIEGLHDLRYCIDRVLAQLPPS